MGLHVQCVFRAPHVRAESDCRRRHHRPRLRRACRSHGRSPPRVPRPRLRHRSRRRSKSSTPGSRSSSRFPMKPSPRCARQASKRPIASTDLSEPDAILICVPTPLTEAREPDLTYVVNSANAIASRLRPRATRRARKHDLSQHDAATSCCRSWNASGLDGGPRLLPRVQPRARRPGQRRRHSRQPHSEGRRRPGRRQRRRRLRTLLRRSCRTWCASRRRKWRRRARFWRTRTAPSTSRW